MGKLRFSAGSSGTWLEGTIGVYWDYTYYMFSDGTIINDFDIVFCLGPFSFAVIYSPPTPLVPVRQRTKIPKEDPK